MATPVNFGELGAMTTLMRRVEPEDLLDETGNVPSDVIRSSFKLLQPTGTLTSYANLWQHLWNDDFVSSHQLMTQWAMDHIPFPGACFDQVTRLLGRQDLLGSGRVPLGARTVDLKNIRAPLLTVIGEKDQFISPAAAGDVAALVGSTDTEELRLTAGHVGLIAGRSAHKRNLPLIADWLERHSEAQ
jgi:polyhydroxyalkanoate synthase